MDLSELKDFLDEKSDFYNHRGFIENDPISIPHRFTKKQDIEIAGFLTATISWGNRKSILKSAEKMLGIMDYSPHDFVLNFTEKDIQKIAGKPLHRTFNGDDLSEFLRNLKRIYSENESLETLFLLKPTETNMYHAFHRFREQFFAENMAHRSTKHISSTYKNSAAKRLMMYLRWMVRNDRKGVDFGIWQNSNPAFLSVPLDVHTANISRKLNLVSRKQNDWKTVEELDHILRKFNSEDPAVYDFALFGLGVSGDF